MNPEQLEKLMMDKALGVLPSDYAALLTAYLETRPEAAAACREIDRTVDLVKCSLGTRSAEPLPPFPAVRLRRTRRTDRTWRKMRGFLAVAASFLIGFGIHAFLFQTPTPGPCPQPDIAVVTRERLPRNSEIHGDGNDFWSARRLYEQSRASRPSPRRVIWDSPGRFPYKGNAS